MKTRLLIGVAAMLLAATGTAFAQNGARLIAYDALTAGRGGVATGTFDNPSLLMNNPAGISFLSQSQLDINFSLMVPGLKYSNAYNSNANDIQHYFPLPSVSFVKKLNNSKLTWGAGLFVQGGMGAEFELNHPLFTDGEGAYVKQQYYSNFAVMQGGPSLAYQLDPKLSIGLSAHVMYSQMTFNMPFSLPPAAMQGVIYPGQSPMTFGDLFAAPQNQGGLGYTEVTAYSKMEDLRAFGFNGKLGLAYKPSDRVSLGLQYSSPVTLKYRNGTASMNMNAQMGDAFGRVVTAIMQNSENEITPEEAQQQAAEMFGQMGIDLTKGASAVYDLGNKMKLPQSLSVGINVKATEKIRVGLDVEWVNWKNAFDKMVISLSNGTNANINRMMGNDGSFTMDFPLQWKNSVVIRTGLEADLGKAITARAGYAYGNNPVPSSTLFPVFPAIIEHHVMAGLTYKASSKIGINLAYEAGLNNTQQASGHSLIAEEFNNSKSSLKTSIFHLSVSWRL